MRGAEIAMIVCIAMQIGATVLALLLVNQTKYRALWWCCIIGLTMLTAERVLQLFEWDGINISNLTFAWVGTIVSVSFSVSVVCAHMLVRHVDRMTNHRRMLENRLMTAVLRTEERSRASFSRELHDGLGPLLSSAKMSISALQRADLSDKDRTTLANTSAVIDEAIRSLREISNNLSPHILNNFGLMRGIKNFVDRVVSLHDVRIDFRTSLRAERFDSNIEVILYRVVCELINNSLKHSGCKNIELTLEQKDSRLNIEYRDDGCGFLPHDADNVGMGLSNIRSRISSLGGKLQLTSHPGRGMAASISVSTDSANAHLTSSEYDQLYNTPKNDKKRKNSSRR
ncbi:MAG: sensor histidine kinase [Alistipes sp.]|nr:sensor histidine kinase [Alistipes sp.]